MGYREIMHGTRNANQRRTVMVPQASVGATGVLRGKRRTRTRAECVQKDMRKQEPSRTNGPGTPYFRSLRRLRKFSVVFQVLGSVPHPVISSCSAMPRIR